MSIAPKAGPSPRYGSPAQLAAYAGLSVKTIRRLVDAGTVPGRKVGRRVLIPFEDLDRLILGSTRRPAPGSSPAMATAAATPRSSTDARGRAIPLSPAEARRRSEEAIRALDEVAEMGDEAEQRATLDALMRAVDEDPLSDRKRFR